MTPALLSCAVLRMKGRQGKTEAENNSAGHCSGVESLGHTHSLCMTAPLGSAARKAQQECKCGAPASSQPRCNGQWVMGKLPLSPTAPSFTHFSILQILAKRQEREGVRLALEGQCTV